jgi:hypothetical protein
MPASAAGPRPCPKRRRRFRPRLISAPLPSRISTPPAAGTTRPPGHGAERGEERLLLGLLGHPARQRPGPDAQPERAPGLGHGDLGTDDAGAVLPGEGLQAPPVVEDGPRQRRTARLPSLPERRLHDGCRLVQGDPGHRDPPRLGPVPLRPGLGPTEKRTRPIGVPTIPRRCGGGKRKSTERAFPLGITRALGRSSSGPRVAQVSLARAVRSRAVLVSGKDRVIPHL